MSDHEPVFRVPPACLFLVLTAAAVHALHVMQMIPDAAFANYAVRPALFWQAPLSLHALVTLFTYQFLHASWMHLAVNLFSLLAFGSAMERRAGRAWFLMLYLFFGIVAALAHMFVYADQQSLLIGASGAISGVMGFVLWRLLKESRIEPRTMIAILALQPILAIASGDLLGGEIAWLAHMAGFGAGVLTALVFQPEDKLVR